MAVRIQVRRGTASEWTASDVVLAAGEIGAETDTHRFKLGDGVTPWTTLPYSSGPPGVQGLTGPMGPIGNQAVFSAPGDLYPRVGETPYYLDQNQTITRIRVGLGSPSVGGPVVLNLLVNGVVAQAVTLPEGDVTVGVSTNLPVSADDAITVAIVSVGATDPGAGLTVSVTLE